jgi:hypothetical protein
MILLSDGILLESSSKEKQMGLFSNGSKVNLTAEQIETVVENYNGKIYYNASSKEVVSMIIGSKVLRSKLMYPMMRQDGKNSLTCYNWLDTIKYGTTIWHSGSDTTLGRLLATAVNRFICSQGEILYAKMSADENGIIKEFEIESDKDNRVHYIDIKDKELNKRKFATLLDICNRNRVAVSAYTKYDNFSRIWVNQDDKEYINDSLVREIGDIK